jgi:hypothetical protein
MREGRAIATPQLRLVVNNDGSNRAVAAAIPVRPVIVGKGVTRTLTPVPTPVKEKGVPAFKGSWIPFYSNMRTNAKVKKCSKYLGTSLVQTIGHLGLLWSWTLEQRVGGDLSKFDNEDIAHAAMWEGDPDQFVDALERARLVDRVGDGYAIHDWDEYGGLAENDRERRANREAVRRAGLDPESLVSQKNNNSNDVTVTSPSHNRHVLHNITGQNKTVHNNSSNLRTLAPQKADDAMQSPSQFEQMMGDDAIAFVAKSLSSKIPGFTERQFRTILKVSSAASGPIDKAELDKRLTSVRELADHIAERQKSPNQQRRLSNPLVWAIKAMNARMAGNDDITSLIGTPTPT